MEEFLCDELTYTNVLVELQDIWDGGCGADADSFPAATANKLMTQHGMKILSEVKSGDTCLGWDAYWVDTCQDKKVTKSEVPSYPDNCDIPEGEGEISCNKETYSKNCFLSSSFSFTDIQCPSRLAGIDFTSRLLDEEMKAMRQAIMESNVDMMLACAQPNVWEGTYGCPVGTLTEFTSAQFNADLLYHIQNIARHHGCNDYCIIDDSNFWELWQQTQDGKCCTDEGKRAGFNRFDITFDTFLDEYLGRRSTFLVNPKCFGFINTCKYDNTVPRFSRNVGDAQIFEWKINDPILRILETDSVTGRQSIVPVCYDIEYKKECAGRHPVTGKTFYKHTYYITYEGGQFVAPTSCGKEKCVFEFTNIG